MRKFFATLLALVMVLSLMVPTAWAAEGDVTILYTNDVHTYINQEVKLEDESKVPGIQYSWIAALKDSLGENVLLVDAGDHAQGTAYGGMDKGKTIIDLMNAAGYDVATMGNHEFDYGMDIFLGLAEKAEFKELAVPGNFPYVEMGGVPFKPKASKKCIDCGLCAKKCPTGAIPMDNFKITDKDKCITCMRCVEICPTDARDFPEILLKGAFMVMKAKFERRKPNKLYIAD